jgi:hypothetical protein
MWSSLCLELINFLFLLIGKPSFLSFPRRDCLDYARIIPYPFFVVEGFHGGRRHFKFKNMWLNQRGLWIR